jgi:hypothetical protein
LLLGALQFCDVGIKVQASEGYSFGIPPDCPSTGNDYLLSITGDLFEFVFPIAFSAEDILDLSQRPG